MNKKIRIMWQVLTIVIGYCLLTVYGYYNDPTPPNKYSWLEAFIIVIPISCMVMIYDFFQHKKEKTIKDKLKGFLALNDSQILYFKYSGNYFGNKKGLHLLVIEWRNEHYEFTNEKGKIYFNRTLIKDYSNIKEKIDMIDKIIEVMQEQLFSNSHN